MHTQRFAFGCRREKASLFVSAVGVPPKWVVDSLHNAGWLSLVFI